eukprot:3040246-Pyramimonas_sp.AAC.1
MRERSRSWAPVTTYSQRGARPESRPRASARPRKPCCGASVRRASSRSVAKYGPAPEKKD